MTKTLEQYLKDELTTDRATVFGPGQGEILNINGGRITLKVTSSISRDQLGVYEIYLEPGTVGAQLHYHRYMDETFVVTTGTSGGDPRPDQSERRGRFGSSCAAFHAACLRQ